MQHIDKVAHGNRQRAAGTSFADDGADDGHFQLGQFVQVFADGFGLVALFRTDAGIGSGRIDEGQYGQAEFFRQMHQAQGFAVAFGARHAEVAADFFFGVAAFLVADDDDALAVKPRQTADDGVIVGIVAVAVQFLEIGTERGDVVQSIGTLRMAGNLGNLCRRELGIDGFGQLVAFFLQAFDFIADVHGGFALDETQFFDFFGQFGNRLLEIKKDGFHAERSR